MITFQCQGCGKRFEVGEQFAGRRAKCKCGRMVTVPAAAPAPLPAPELLGHACPGCGQTIAAQAIICINCGYDRRTGRRVTASDAGPRARMGGTAPPSLAAVAVFRARRATAPAQPFGSRGVNRASSALSKVSSESWGEGICVLAISFYCIFTYSGPYRWLAERQLSIFGAYVPKLTAVIVMLMFLGLFRVLRFAVGLLGLKIPDRPIDRPMFRPRSAVGMALLSAAPFVVVGLFPVIWAMTWYARASSAGPRTEIALTDLEPGKRPASSWVRVQGKALRDMAFTFGPSGSEEVFVPVVAPTAGSSHESHLILKMSKGKPFSADDKAFEGLLAPADLSGPVREKLRRDGVIHGDDYYVLELDRSPSDLRQTGEITCLIGCGFVAVGVVMGLIKWARCRQMGG